MTTLTVDNFATVLTKEMKEIDVDVYDLKSKSEDSNYEFNECESAIQRFEGAIQDTINSLESIKDVGEQLKNSADNVSDRIEREQIKIAEFLDTLDKTKDKNIILFLTVLNNKLEESLDYIDKVYTSGDNLTGEAEQRLSDIDKVTEIDGIRAMQDEYEDAETDSDTAFQLMEEIVQAIDDYKTKAFAENNYRGDVDFWQ